MRVLTVVFLIAFVLLSHEQFYGQVTENGVASYYNDALEGRKTASGELYQQKKLTAAHRTLPFDTKIKVTNLRNKRYVVVRINDRGPFVEGRILDLSKEAAIRLDFLDQGLTEVRLDIVEKKKGGKQSK